MAKSPNVSVVRVLRLRETLARAAYRFEGLRIVGERLDVLAEALADSAGVPQSAVAESLRPLVGSVWTPELAAEVCWRLGGNLAELKAGRPARPWAGGPLPEFAPGQVRDVHFLPGPRPKYDLEIRILAGPLCPRIERYALSKAQCRLFARELGFSAPYRNRPFTAPVELVQLRALFALNPAESTPKRVAFTGVRCTPALRAHNLQILKLRFREDWRCPRGYSHACRVCPVGYDECPAGCRSVTVQQPPTQSDAQSP